MEQPHPDVTDADVERVVRRDFSSGDIQAVTNILNEYGAAKWQREAARVRLAVLKLAAGDVAQVRSIMDDAKIDYRDILSGGEYPSFSTRGWDLPELSADERDKIFADDWKQYQDWLNCANAGN